MTDRSTDDSGHLPTEQLAGLVAAMPFAAGLGIRLESAGPRQAVGVLDWAEERCTVGGVLHGAALMSLGDTVGAVCAFLNLPPGAGTATLESKSNLFRPVRSGTVRATSQPLHVGRTVVVVQTDLRDDDGRLVAQVTQTQAVLPAPG